MIKDNRKILLNYNSDTVRIEADERKKLEQPPYEKRYEGKAIELTKNFENMVKRDSVRELLDERCSTRDYLDMPLTMDELSYILWYTYGVKAVLGTKRKATLRTVPSAGARHSIETYLIINNVETLQGGLYHYNGINHTITMIKPLLNSYKEASKVACDQEFIEGAAVVFMWTCTPYRMEWRYPDVAIKYALIDVGHLCENLYIGAASLACGVCGIGAYYQDYADQLIGINTHKDNSEVTVYMAALGKKK